MKKLMALATLARREAAKLRKILAIILALVGAHLVYFASKIKTRHYLQRADLVPHRASPGFHLKTNPTARNQEIVYSKI
jgi:hypothetical protein